MTAATVVKSGKGYAAAKTFWEGHVPANETAESFFTGADANRFEFSFIYAGVGVLAAALKPAIEPRLTAPARQASHLQSTGRPWWPA